LKRLIIFTLVFMLTLQFVLAGVTNPLPGEIELLKGESGRFKFQIQAVNRPTDIECTFNLEGDSPLIVEFDDATAFVEANSVKDFYGTVDVPRKLDYGKYTQSFCVECNPKDKLEGATVQIYSCGLPINVAVVKERTKNNMNVPGKPFDYALLVAVLVVAIIVIIIIFKKKKKSGKLKAKPNVAVNKVMSKPKLKFKPKPKPAKIKPAKKKR